MHCLELSGLYLTTVTFSITRCTTDNIGCRTIPPGQFPRTIPLPFGVGLFPPDNSPNILCIHTYTCMHTHTYTYIHTYIHIRVHTYIHTFIYMHTYTYIHIQAYIHIHLYVCM